MNQSLLDTDILSEVLKKRNSLVLQNARNYLAEHQRFSISAFTRYEILRGLKDKGASRQLGEFEKFCRQIEILPISSGVLDLASELWVTARQGGHPRFDADLMIAASAIFHGRVLVSGNTPHYDWIDSLELENWRVAR